MLDDHDAANNMATDEVLLQSVAAGGLPTLRFYGWSRPTLSLGYFQSVEDAAAWREATVDEAAVEIVRRSTGGGAILHQHELTMSLALPMASSNTGAREATYLSVHAAIRDELVGYGVSARPYREVADARHAEGSNGEPFLCFQRRTDEDLIVAGYKVLGSAQRRAKNALLQHGSLLLHVSPYADVLPGIAQLTGMAIDRRDFAERLADRLRDVLHLDWRPGELTATEIQSAETIATERYGHPAWTAKR